MERSALCRSRRELSNAYLLAEFGFDTAENEPLKVCQQLAKVRIKVRKNIGISRRGGRHGRAVVRSCGVGLCEERRVGVRDRNDLLAASVRLLAADHILFAFDVAHSGALST